MDSVEQNCRTNQEKAIACTVFNEAKCQLSRPFANFDDFGYRHFVQKSINLLETLDRITEGISTVH